MLFKLLLKKNTSYLLIIIIAVLGLFFSITSCQKKVEGCTEAIARNYDPEADKNCCCQYYNIQITQQFLAGDSLSLFALGQPFLLPSGEIVVPQKFFTLIHNIELVKSNGQAFAVNDTVKLNTANGLIDFSDDFTLLSASSFVYNVGKFSRLDTFVRLRFTVGLRPNAAVISAGDVADNSNPLSLLASPLLYDSSRLVYNTTLFNIAFSNPVDTVKYAFANDIQIDLACNIIAVDGRDVSVELNLYCANVFTGIDFRNDIADTVRAKVVRNLATSFGLR